MSLNSLFKLFPMVTLPPLQIFSSYSFLDDRYIQMRAVGKKPIDMQQYTAIEVPRQIASPKVIILKAVHKASGEIVGWVSFALRGFEQKRFAALDPASKFGDQGGLLPVSNSAPSEQPDVKEASFSRFQKLEKITSGR